MKTGQLPVWGALLVAILLAGCSKEETNLPNNKYPLTLTTTVEGLTVSRATADAPSSWVGNEEVAVQIGSTVKKYTVDDAASGKLTAAADPWYWTSSAEQKTVSAWYPYGTPQPTMFYVQADQSGDGYRQSDLIYAPAAAISFANPSLTFRHLPVKIVVNLKNGDGVRTSHVRGATVSIVGQQLNSGTIADDWSVTQQVTMGGNTVIPNVLGSAADGYQKSVQALVVPQKYGMQRRFIKVTVDRLEFYYTTTTDFAAGKQYTYNITVKRTGLTVTASGGGGWTGGTPIDVTSNELPAG